MSQNQLVVLQCLLNIDKPYDLISQLKREYFNSILEVSIYDYILELINKGIKPDLSLIKSRFPKEKIELPEVDCEHYKEFADNLRKDYIGREIKRIGQALSTREVDENKFVNYINQFLDNIIIKSPANIHYVKDTIEEVLQEINSEQETRSEITYGFDSIDNHTKGAFPGDQTIIAGRPSMGKSAFMANMLLKNALNGKVCLGCSLEMSAKSILIRMLANEADIEIWKLGRLSHRQKEEQDRVMQVAKRLKEIPLIIDTTPDLSVNDIRSIAQKIKLQYGRIDLIVVDYLQLMEGRGENDNSRVSAMSRGLKNLAMQFNIPVVAGSQLSRQCEMRENKRPILSDLRDSGAIEQDADLVFFLYRDGYYSGNREHDRVLEILIRKFRNGETGKVLADYNLKKQSIKSWNYNIPELKKLAQRFEHE